MSDKRLIDGDTVSRKALLEWANDQPTTNAPYYLAYAKCKIDFLEDLESGRFDTPSNQGEAVRLREALEKIQKLRVNGLGLSIAHCYGEVLRIADEALSFQAEDKKEYGYTCPNCEHFIKAEEAITAGMRCPTCKVREIVPLVMVTKSEDTGIQKVRELWNGLQARGDLTAMDAIEKTLISLSITIPGITDGSVSDE